MKRLFVIIHSLVFSIILLNSCSENSSNVQNFTDFAGWKSANLGINNNLYALHFVTADSGWAGGDDGIILFTSDGGETWMRQSTPSSLTIYSIHFIDRVNGWAAGGKFANNEPYQPIVLKTTDAGETWNEISVTADDVLFNTIEFFDKNIGWLAGVSNARNFIFRTSDGGDSWIKLENVQNGRPITSIDVMDSLNVYLAGDSLVLATNDGGESWVPYPPQSYIWITDIQFINQFTGFVCGWGGKFQRTNSAGLAWEQVIIESGNDLYSICFTDEFNGWASGNIGALYHTTNGGLGWGKISSPFTVRINKVFFFDKDNGCFVGDYGLIYRTRSGGL